jgi:aryl-alcohol dehydrogenase-like predicted oxidoreductase
MKSLAIAERYGLPRHVAHQAYYSLIGRDYEWELMPLAIDQNVGTVVWSPLSGGRLSGKMGRGQPAPAGTRTAVLGAHGPDSPPEQFYAVIDVLREIAAEHGRSVAQIALNWVLHRPTVSTLVIGARNADQLRDNLGTAEFRLSDQQVRRLDAASEPQPIYPYWHQRLTFKDRNPPPV